MPTTEHIPKELSWQAATHVDHDRSAHWYTVAGLLTATAIVYSVIMSAWTSAVVIALAAGLYYLVRNEEHPKHTIAIRTLGIEYDGKLSPWNDWKHFWILIGPYHAELHVTHKAWKPELCILTGGVDPFVVRDTLSQYIPQNPEKRERFLDAFVRFCKI